MGELIDLNEQRKKKVANRRVLGWFLNWVTSCGREPYRTDYLRQFKEHEIQKLIREWRKDG